MDITFFAYIESNIASPVNVLRALWTAAKQKLLERAFFQTLRGEKRTIKAMAAKPTTNKLNSLGSGVIACIGWTLKPSASGAEKETGVILTGAIAGFSTG